jgi:acetyltransferase-like isoleucine patch superfamily enzyme
VTAHARRAGPLTTAVVGALPHSRFKTVLMNRVLGWRVHPSAHVGPSLFLRVAHVSLGPGAYVLSLSAFHDVDDLRLDENAVIGHWNWISAARALRTPALDARAGGRPASLSLGRGATVTSRHYIDCSGGVSLGAFTVLAGVRSTIISHQVDPARSEQDVKPVAIGDYCLIGSNAKIVPGARIPNRCVVAMGAVVVGALAEEGFLYAGVPARPVKPVGDGLYFTRTTSDAGIP